MVNKRAVKAFHKAKLAGEPIKIDCVSCPSVCFHRILCLNGKTCHGYRNYQNAFKAIVQDQATLLARRKRQFDALIINKDERYAMLAILRREESRIRPNITEIQKYSF